MKLNTEFNLVTWLRIVICRFKCQRILTLEIICLNHHCKSPILMEIRFRNSAVIVCVFDFHKLEIFKSKSTSYFLPHSFNYGEVYTGMF